jgi:outer membrane protein OmpA-like peptidoglycan-associated protein
MKLGRKQTIILKIISHTDTDGNDDENLKLSKSRAEAVKQALVNVYKIKGSRLISEGKGESNSIADNTTLEGKAKNRPVEFIKQKLNRNLNLNENIRVFYLTILILRA